ncbi:alpha/beta hydrolase [Shewanella sp. GXUN23E]|uniref:alpha/beta hydrolase n=1 Tax=Shewanella sp. GXUN23E TaxID=3422498 RepID=UPI003D7DFAC6
MRYPQSTSSGPVRRGISLIYIGLQGMFTSCALLLAGITAAQAANDIFAHTQACHIEGIDEKVRCGSVTVAENPDKPDGRQIDVHYVVLPAIKNADPDKALLAIAGGPGQSAIENAAYFNQMLGKVRQFRDILLIDQRGTGLSQPLACEDMTPINALAYNDENLDMPALTQACLQQQQADVTQYGSLSAVRDFEAVRQAAGYSKLDIYGISYGTRMAQVYLKHYPQVLTTVTLDGVVPMQQNLMYISEAIARATDLMLTDCEQNAACQQAFPQLRSQLAEVEQQLAQQPVSAKVNDPMSGEVSELLLTRSKFLGAIRMALYSPTTRSLLPYAINQAAAGNYQPILGLYGLTTDGAGIAMGMHASVVCGEDIPFVDDTVEQVANRTFVGSEMLSSLREVCSVWQVPPVDPSFHQPVNSDVPVLLLSGEMDPATPPSWAELAMVDLRNATHLISPYAGHGVASQTCANGLIATLVKTGSLKEQDASCLDRDISRSFYLNANTVEPLATANKE